MNSSNSNVKPGSLRTWLDYLEGIDPDKIELGLNRVSTVFKRLNPDFFNHIPVIEVAGTNGKGSSSALIASALNLSGCKTGLYTSPHLLRFNERIVIGGAEVTDEELCIALKTVHDAADGIALTYFEYTTLAAFVCFINAKVDAVVLEIGLGGRLDAVNILDCDIALITSIGLDHTHILGDTVEKIAYEKAGIIKKGKCVVTGIIDKSPLNVIREYAKSVDAQCYFETESFDYTVDDDTFVYKDLSSKPDGSASAVYSMPKIPLCCAPSSIKVLHLLKERGLDIKDTAINKALDTTSLPGRMQLVHKNPSIYLDVAHNPPAAVHLKESVLKRRERALRKALNCNDCKKAQGRNLAVIGMLKDKDVESVLKIVSTIFDAFYVATLHTGRGEQKERLKNSLLLCDIDANLIKSFDKVEDALNQAVNDADANDEIVVLGSFVTVKEAADTLIKNNYQEK